MPWRRKLSIHGIMQLVKVLKTEKTKVAVLEFVWTDAVCDAAILAGLTFFTSLAGTSVLELDLAKSIMAAAISSAAQFFAVLALKRGLIKQEAKAA